MTETPQHYHRPLKPLGNKGDILPRDTSRFSKLSSEPPAVLKEGAVGYLAPNPNVAEDGLLLCLSSNPADALPMAGSRHHTQPGDVDVCEDDN